MLGLVIVVVVMMMAKKGDGDDEHCFGNDGGSSYGDNCDDGY